MSLECSECEHDVRNGHLQTCSRYNEGVIMPDDQVTVEPNEQEQFETIRPNPFMDPNVDKPAPKTRMGELYDEWIDAKVILHDGRTGVVCMVDPRPRGHKDGEWLGIKLDHKDPTYAAELIVYTLPTDVRRLN